MSGQSRLIKADMARQKTPKGSALKDALNPKTMQSKLLAIKGNEKQPIKGKKA